MAKASKATFSNAEIRTANVVRRDGADGPEQYLRVVIHAELPGDAALDQVTALNKIGKSTVILEIERAQKTLPGIGGGAEA